MAKKTGKSRVKRISGKLDDLLIGMSQKNEINFVDAGDIIVDIINKKDITGNYSWIAIQFVQEKDLQSKLVDSLEKHDETGHYSKLSIPYINDSGLMERLNELSNRK